MQRTLILMRHAKSSWADPGMEDFDRPLNARGRHDAPRMGEWLKSSGYRPDVVLVSPARRTRETLEGVRDGFERKLSPRFEADIYGAEAGALLDILRAQTAANVMLLGHNPGCEDLLRYLVDAADLDVGYPKLVPTAAIYVVEFDRDWPGLEAACGSVVAHARPRKLSADG